MRHKRRFFVAFMVLTLTLISHHGESDITPMDYQSPPAGGGVSPKSPHQAIRLESQDVIIRLSGNTYTVDAVFHLFNSGETSTEWIGFPKQVRGRAPGPSGGVMEFVGFAGSANGREITFKEERDHITASKNLLNGLHPLVAKHARWLVGTAVFPGHSKTTIRIRYKAVYANWGFLCEKADYIYGTGGYWKGAIGTASFIVDCTAIGGVDRASIGFSSQDTRKRMIHKRLLSKDIIKYELREFEPNPSGSLTILLVRGRHNENDTQRLTHAALNCRLQEIKRLLKKGVDANAVDSFGHTPLENAARQGCLEAAKLLVEKGADVNARNSRGRTALKAAMEGGTFDDRGHLKTALWLKERGAKPDTLAVAAFVGDMEAVRRMLAQGANLNEWSRPDDQTPLMAAAMGGQLNVVKFLLDNGLKVNDRNGRHETALIVAARAGHADVIKFLIEKGAEVHARDSFGRTALNHAIFLRGHLEAIKVLLDNGADIEDREAPGTATPLMLAAHDSQIEVVKLLLKRGANVNATNAEGKTALDMAHGKHINEIEKILKAHGAK